MAKYQIVAIVETEEPLGNHDMRRILDEIRESAFTWDAGSGERIKGHTSDIPISIKRIDGSHALADDAMSLT